MANPSPNATAQTAATTADEADMMLGPSVAVILDDGPTRGPEPSTIVDVTGPQGRILRTGAVPLERLNEIVASIGVEIVDQG